MPKIKYLMVADGAGSGTAYHVGVSGVSEIENKSVDYIHSIFEVFDMDGDLMARVEKAPVVIEYFKPNEGESH